MNAIASLDDLQHSIINRMLRDELAECMRLPYSGIIGLRRDEEDWVLHWLAGPTAALAARLGAGFDFAASLGVIAAEYAALPPASAPDLVGIGLLSTAQGQDTGLRGFATLVADVKVHTVRWGTGAVAPTWRIQARADAEYGMATGLAAVLAALTQKAVS